MNVLMVGAGKGSWQMRGEQLGAALGARVTSSPTADDWRWADLAILLKKHAPTFARVAHKAGVPIVWDALDFWRQPTDNGVSELVARDLLAHHIEAMQPALTIGATQAMADAAGGVYLTHHAWAGLRPTPAREHVKTVAYQGGEVFLGNWRAVLERECKRRGWMFVVNPPDLSAVDILVALRDGQWDGWICRQWKSGVKLVNAIAAGRPIIAQSCAAWDELTTDGAIVNAFAELGAAFDAVTQYDVRQAVVERSLSRAHAFTVEYVAAQYRAILDTQVVRCAA